LAPFKLTLDRVELPESSALERASVLGDTFAR
jgi:hypothetical protein